MSTFTFHRAALDMFGSTRVVEQVAALREMVPAE
jgi:hypothetical protein